MRRVFDNEYYAVDIDFVHRRIEMTRTPVPFRDLPAVLTTIDGFVAAIEAAGAGSFALLVDSTDAPDALEGRYKKVFGKMADYLNTRFSRIAVVLASRESALRELEASPRKNIDFFTNRTAARRALSFCTPSETPAPQSSLG